MTEIEQMWDKAVDDAEHKLVNGDLMSLAGYICTNCGSEVTMDKKSGCLDCSNCGNKECGDS